MPRASVTIDVFHAVAEARRREILDALLVGEKPVGTLARDLALSQPQVSKDLRVLRDAGLVRCRAEGRRRLYRLEPAHLAPVRDWLAHYERALGERLDRLDTYLTEHRAKGETP